MKANLKEKKSFAKKIVILVFLFFIGLTLFLIPRNFFVLESLVKSTTSFINSSINKKFYGNSKLDSNIIESKLSSLKEENKNLKALLDIKTKQENYVAATVTNHISNILFNNIDINKGKNSKLEKGNPVINDKGLVGFIKKTSNNLSEVELITNVNEDNMFSVLIGTKEISGLLSSYDKKSNTFTVTNVMSKDDLLNSNVVLSGFENSNYKGLYIGKVVEDKLDNYGLSKTLKIKSEVDFSNILYVLVVTDN